MEFHTAHGLGKGKSGKTGRQTVRSGLHGTYIRLFYRVHGDRGFSDDKALIGGIGFLDGQPVTVIADLKGKSFEECQERNFGMPLPEGYRKALRLMKQAEKFNRPIVSFVNTSGAFCGIEAE